MANSLVKDVVLKRLEKDVDCWLQVVEAGVKGAIVCLKDIGSGSGF